MRKQYLSIMVALAIAIAGILGGRAMADRPDGSPTAVDVVLRPEWAAHEGTDKNFTAQASDKTRNTGAQLDYTVPADKTLYITQFTFASHASLAADADLNQICHARIYDSTDAVYYVNQGGNGGGSANITKPIVIPAGHVVSFLNTNRANHNCELFLHAGGYEE